ncbi:hypothetical protein AAF712_002863 [Marasmius tenuissimus]|uniref:Uncharacterized protein n=1 Tax=Marasmius tenuissimus TaxID=585030 RepID=A0ABR3A7I5_9AGAR
MDIADLIVRIRVLLIGAGTTGQSGTQIAVEDLKARNAKADDLTEPLMWTGTLIFIFALSIGDTVLLWRTWALYQHQLWYVALPALTLLGSFVAAFYELGCLIHTDWSLDFLSPNASSSGADACKKADKSSYTLSFVTNIVCTGLICWRAWEHRRYMNKALGFSRKKTKVDRMLVLFCESGALYLVLYTIQSIPIYNHGLSSNALIGMNIVNAVIQQAMGMYPTAIVVLCHIGGSFWDGFDVPSTATTRGVGGGVGDSRYDSSYSDGGTATYVLDERGKGPGHRVSRIEFAPPPREELSGGGGGGMEMSTVDLGVGSCSTGTETGTGTTKKTAPCSSSSAVCCSCTCGGCACRVRTTEGDVSQGDGERAPRRVYIQRREKKVGEVGYFDYV